MPIRDRHCGGRARGGGGRVGTIRDRLIYIHIPKTGGTFILNTIFFKNNLQSEHNTLITYKKK